LYVVPKFGGSDLDRIDRDSVKRFILDLRARGLAKNTIRLAVTTLRAVINAAVEDGLVSNNPAQGLGRFIKSERAARESSSLKPGEGELAGLQWGDIQFGDSDEDPDRYMLVQRNYDRRWSRTMLTPKSRKSRRVDRGRELRRLLLQLRDERLVKAFAQGKLDISEELVFPSDAGTPIEMNNFTARVFKPLLTNAGLRNIRFHDLRHTFGSLLIQTGASLAYVRDQMGHSSIQVTVDIYGHLIPSANISFVDMLDTLTCPQQSAIQPQQRIRKESDDLPQVLANVWLGGRDSNPDTQIQSLQSYH